jgi:hypothetical protein
MRRLGVFLVIAGCQGAGTPPVDALDAVVATPGLFVRWNAQPSVPGPVSASVTLSRVTFQVDRFEVQSDADGGTSHARYPLTWSASTAPAPEAFPDAPSGLYSRVAITFGGFFENAYEIEGTWLDHDTATPFRIADRITLKTSLELSATLSAGGAATIGVALELSDTLASIDFHRLHDDHGVLELSTGDPQLLEFRERLAKAFVVTD